MALFGKMFEKKSCDICGKETGRVFGNNKVEDGNMCNDCVAKLSPYFEGRRHSTLAQIREQLAYREENRSAVDAFAPTRTLGTETKVYIDEDDQKVIVTRFSDWRSNNPDVFDYTQITGCKYDVDERRSEITYTDDEGKKKSYDPPRYEYEYSFYITIDINHPYVSRIRFKLNQNTIERRGSVEYISCENQAKEICEALTQVREGVRQAKEPKAAMQCPHCMATTMPDANGRCEYCGGALF